MIIREQLSTDLKQLFKQLVDVPGFYPRHLIQDEFYKIGEKKTPLTFDTLHAFAQFVNFLAIAFIFIVIDQELTLLRTLL